MVLTLWLLWGLLLLIFCSMKMMSLGFGFWVVFFFGIYSVWCSLNFLHLWLESVIFRNSQTLLLQILLLLLLLSSPIIHMLYLLQLYHSYRVFYSVYFSVFKNLHSVWEVCIDVASNSLAPGPWPVYWGAHHRHSSSLLQRFWSPGFCVLL